MPSGKRRVHPLVVFIVTTANGMHPPFVGRRPKLFIIFDLYLYQVIMVFAEVKTDIARIH